MYALKPEPTAFDVLVRSLICHPTLYAEALGAAAATHNSAAALMRYSATREIAARLASAAALMSADAARQPSGAEADTMAQQWISYGMDYWITALNVAGRLQCLPADTLRQAAGRTKG